MIQWDFIGPRFSAPSCALVDVYAHLSDKLWKNPYGGYMWVSQLDEGYIKSLLKKNNKNFKPGLLLLLQRELERKETLRESGACNIEPDTASYYRSPFDNPRYVSYPIGLKRQNRF